MVTEEEYVKGVMERNGHPDTFVRTASKPSTAAELTEESEAKSIYSVHGRTELGHETGVQTIQHQDCLPISIHSLQTAGAS